MIRFSLASAIALAADLTRAASYGLEAVAIRVHGRR